MSLQHLDQVQAIMREFAARTGLAPVADEPRRYLWTDAFAVCNYLSLFSSTSDETFLGLAVRLIDQVHETLARHRADSAGTGWISGLEEAAGRNHPTAGGLRIGKLLAERPAGQPIDERDEWDRDGQYFHYLTKWMHALERTAVVTADAKYCRWAIELAGAAHSAFSYRAADGSERMVWKMSIDLARPLVPSMGHHDPLDALVSYSMLEHCREACFADAGLPDLASELASAESMCAGRDWVTQDPLGIGGLLVDANRIGQLLTHGRKVAGVSLAGLLTDARIGFAGFAQEYPLQDSADRRLAFRELGLTIGLHAIEALRALSVGGQRAGTEAIERELERLLSVAGLAEQVETFWLNPENQAGASWRDHIDINSVMLATSLQPGQALLV